MCGISGGFYFGAVEQRVDPDVIARLNEHQRRRGPDGEGLWSSPDHRVVLGHRRLAVIDTSAGGAQPMADASSRWTITFNGEIYNFRQLRTELEQLGCQFKTASDTEVLINVVARWGMTGLLKLRGMYAFALWDSLEKELWLVRDPYGIKPLYIAESDGMIWFASQARALARCAPVNAQTSSAASVGFYLWGFVPEPFSWWTGIRALPAGHALRIRTGKTMPEALEYASIQDTYINRPIPRLHRGELRKYILDSVCHHLVADVQVGLFLSAGIDSSVLAAMAVDLGARIFPITLAFDEYANSQSDEAPAAEELARLLGTEHVTIRIRKDEFEGLLQEFFNNMDQPSTDGLNTFLVSRAAASQGLKVAISGVGGDELFGGYPSFRQIPTLVSLGKRIPFASEIGLTTSKLVRTLAPTIVPPKAAGLLRYGMDVGHAYFLRRSLHLDDELEGLLLSMATIRDGLEQLATMAALTKSMEMLTEAGAPDYAKVAALESGWYMRNQLLRDSDWAGMAHGLEIRMPFVDFALLRKLGPVIASQTPPSKADLASCAKCLPDSIRNRPKTGFTTPINQWISHAGGNARGMRGWAVRVAEEFQKESPHARARAG